MIEEKIKAMINTKKNQYGFLKMRSTTVPTFLFTNVTRKIQGVQQKPTHGVLRPKKDLRHHTKGFFVVLPQEERGA